MEIRLLIDASTEGEWDELVRAQELKESLERQIGEMFPKMTVVLVTQDATQIPNPGRGLSLADAENDLLEQSLPKGRYA